MKEGAEPIHLLMAEDDKEDQMLVRKALEESRVANGLEIVEDGEELMDYLLQRNNYEGAIRPDLILLDLNMPRKDGLEALEEIKHDPELRHIPVIILTTSSAHEDILKSYDLGVNSYIEKPVTFKKLVDVIGTLRRYWFEIVKLPSNT